MPEGIVQCETESIWGILYWVPWLFSHFKDLILDSQTILLSDKCCLIIRAFGAFLYTGLAEREATSQCSDPETVSALLAQSVALSLLQQQPNKLQLWVNRSQQTGGTPRLADFGDRLPSYYSSIPLSWDAPESFSYSELNDIRGCREPEALRVGRKVLQAVWYWPSALPKASVGKEFFGFAELMVSASSEHPLLSSPKPLTNDVASN